MEEQDGRVHSAPVERTVEAPYLEDSQLRRHALLTEGVLTPKHFPSVHGSDLRDLARLIPSGAIE